MLHVPNFGCLSLIECTAGPPAKQPGLPNSRPDRERRVAFQRAPGLHGAGPLSTEAGYARIAVLVLAAIAALALVVMALVVMDATTVIA
jgi:hypothetical protein